jgi:hypothetical protein
VKLVVTMALAWLATAAPAQDSPATTIREATERAIELLPDVAANQAIRAQIAASAVRRADCSWGRRLYRVTLRSA